VQGDTGSATVAGSAVLTVSNLVFGDTAIRGSASITFNDVRINGTPVANGSVQATADLVTDGSLTNLSGSIAATFHNLILTDGFGLGGTANIALNTAGTTTVALNLTTQPSNLVLHLNASVVPQADGSVLVNTFGTNNTVGAYTVQAVNLRVDADACTTGAIGGTLSFTKDGQTGTLGFDSSCTYTYSGP
jgi:hypothetical protein